MSNNIQSINITTSRSSIETFQMFLSSCVDTSYFFTFKVLPAAKQVIIDVLQLKYIR